MGTLLLFLLQSNPVFLSVRSVEPGTDIAFGICVLLAIRSFRCTGTRQRGLGWLIHVRGWISRWVTVLIYLPCIFLTSPRGRSMSVDVPTDSTAVWWEWECGVLCEVDEGTRRESPYCVLLSFIVRLFEFFVFFFFVNVLAYCVVVCRFIAFYSFFFRLVFGFVGARTLTLYAERSSLSSPS